MKHCMKIFGVGLTVFLAVMSLSAVSFAGSGSPEVSSGAPPYGIAMQGDAKGTKLYGTISIEYIGFTSDTAVCPSASCAENSKVVLQLQTANANLINTFYQNIPYLPLDAAAQATALLSAFKSQILQTFFGGDQSLNIVLVSLGEFQLVPSANTDPNYMMASLTLAVN